MKRVIYSIVLVALTVSASLFTGCMSVHKGPAFQQIGITGHDNEAAVYFYRPAKRAGSLKAFNVVENNQLIMKLPNGGYFPCFVKPGLHNFSIYYMNWY